MRTRFYLPAAFLAVAVVSAAQTYSMALKFKEGETIRYRETTTITRTVTAGGKTQIARLTGSHLITLNVTGDSPGRAEMSVSYSEVKVSAELFGLPAGMSANQQERARKMAADVLRQDLSGPPRIQTVDSRGITTFKFAVGEGRTITIENGSFRGLVLPAKPPKMNEKWSAKVSSADPISANSYQLNYKLVGAKIIQGEKAFKIVYSTSETRTEMQQGATAITVMEIEGFVYIGEDSGKLLSGELNVTATTTVSDPERGPGKSVHKTLQKFTKV